MAASLNEPAMCRRPTFAGLDEAPDRLCFEPRGLGPETEGLLRVYRSMSLARQIDVVEARLVAQGAAFFHVSGAGHEGIAILGEFLRPQDYLHLHYRDKALMLARGMPIDQFFHSLLCNANSASHGRQMAPHVSDAQRRILSLVGPVGNQALQAVGVAAELKSCAREGVVLCSIGDGSTQEGEFMEAVAEAARSQPPVLFWISDNRYSISTPTRQKTFYSLPNGNPDQFFGIPITRLDGSNVPLCLSRVASVFNGLRSQHRPAIVLFEVERLTNHTNADDETVYRSSQERARVRARNDPVPNLADYLTTQGVSRSALDEIAAQVVAEVDEAATRALAAPQPLVELGAKRPLPDIFAAAEEPDVNRQSFVVPPLGGAPEASEPGAEGLTMLEALRSVLRRHLEANPRVTLYGEDIEDPKGDVFGVTRGLSTAFPGRVVNSPLSESTIVGASIGRALAGGRPVAFIQFADFLPLAYNQIISELGSMYWRTAGGWECPVIVMVACGGFRPGLGPFHAQTLESVVAHVPGVDVFMPSTASDAAGLLNAAFLSQRPTVFFYPKVCLNDRQHLAPPGVGQHLVLPGTARFLHRGRDLTLVTWGSCVPICEKALDALKQVAATVELIDLRTISPWDQATVIQSVKKTRRLLIVHEDNITCGFGAEVAASVAEAMSDPITIRRLARPDTYIPCNYGNQLEVLPSFARILSAIAEILELDLQWAHSGTIEDSTVRYVDAIGSSPADQTVTVLQWKVAPGDFLQVGQSLAEMEADKAVFEFASPVSGLLEALLVTEDQPVAVGTHLLRVRAGQKDVRPSLAAVSASGKPLLRSRISGRRQRAAPAEVTPQAVGLSRIYAVEGSVEVTNDDLVRLFPGRTPDEIFRLTGIRSRRHISKSQSLLSLAATAALRALEGAGVGPNEIDAIFCSTSTPMSVTPSLACLVRGSLAGEDPEREVVAYDLFAACSGYLYGLSAAFDFLQTRPQAKALVVTAEALSQIVDPADFDTTVLFGDAASATVVHGRDSLDGAWACLERPITTARADRDRILSVPNPGNGFLRMQGKKVFSEAVRSMVSVLQRACAQSGLSASDLALVVPHQANGRILEAVRVRLGLPPERLANSMAEYGNTSSSSIPLALANAARHLRPGSKVGLCAFGGGFTSGAAILSIQHPSALAPTPGQSGSTAAERLDEEHREPASDCLVGDPLVVKDGGDVSVVGRAASPRRPKHGAFGESALPDGGITDGGAHAAND